MEVLKEIRYRGIRKTIGDRMALSFQTQPHHCQGMSADVTRLLELRKELNQSGGIKLTVNDFIVRAAALALQVSPMMNAHLDEEAKKIIVYKSCNIAVIVAVGDALLAPVIKEAQDKDIYQISAECKELVEKARTGTLMPEDYAEGTFTITNLGNLGDEFALPVLFPGQSGILAACKSKKTPVVIEQDGEDIIAIRQVMNLFIVGDHRINDGFPLADFLRETKRLLENPEELMKKPTDLQ